MANDTAEQPVGGVKNFLAQVKALQRELWLASFQESKREFPITKAQEELSLKIYGETGRAHLVISQALHQATTNEEIGALSLVVEEEKVKFNSWLMALSHPNSAIRYFRF